MTSDVVMVATMMGNDWRPVSSTTERFMPKPSRMTAYCRTFLEVKVMPLLNLPLSFHTTAAAMPARMANTGPPMMGNTFPKNQAGTAMARHRARPGRYDFTFFTNFPRFSFSVLARAHRAVPF